MFVDAGPVGIGIAIEFLQFPAGLLSLEFHRSFFRKRELVLCRRLLSTLNDPDPDPDSESDFECLLLLNPQFQDDFPPAAAFQPDIETTGPFEPDLIGIDPGKKHFVGREHHHHGGL